MLSGTCRWDDLTGRPKLEGLSQMTFTTNLLVPDV